jgi:hypothetical protein
MNPFLANEETHLYFETLVRSKPWFTKARMSIRRTSDRAGYTDYRINDRWNAFLAGMKYQASLGSTQT